MVSLTKGIEAKTFSFMSDIICEELPEVPYGVLSGPVLMQNQIVANRVSYDANTLNMELSANSAATLQALTQQLNQQGSGQTIRHTALQVILRR